MAVQRAGPFISATTCRLWRFSQPITQADLAPEPPAAAAQRTGRINVSLADLVKAGVLQPGRGVIGMSYKGSQFAADLTADGAIETEGETEILFALMEAGAGAPVACPLHHAAAAAPAARAGQRFPTPTAFTLYCKRKISPTVSSDDGWRNATYAGAAKPVRLLCLPALIRSPGPPAELAPCILPPFLLCRPPAGALQGTAGAVNRRRGSSSARSGRAEAAGGGGGGASARPPAAPAARGAGQAAARV